MIVVTAGLIEHDGKVLIAQRKPNTSCALKWEFPGGKIEDKESPEMALERELWEELGIRTKTQKVFDARFVPGPDRDLLILFYRTKWISGDPTAKDCNDFRWIDPQTLLEHDLAPTDRAVAQELVKQLQEVKRYG